LERVALSDSEEKARKAAEAYSKMAWTDQLSNCEDCNKEALLDYAERVRDIQNLKEQVASLEQQREAIMNKLCDLEAEGKVSNEFVAEFETLSTESMAEIQSLLGQYSSLILLGLSFDWNNIEDSQDKINSLLADLSAVELADLESNIQTVLESYGNQVVAEASLLFPNAKFSMSRDTNGISLYTDSDSPKAEEALLSSYHAKEQEIVNNIDKLCLDAINKIAKKHNIEVEV